MSSKYSLNIVNRICQHCEGTGRVPDPAATGRKWRRLRREHEITQDQIARQLGFSTNYICMLEKGKKKWPPRMEKRYEAAIKACL